MTLPTDSATSALRYSEKRSEVGADLLIKSFISYCSDIYSNTFRQDTKT